MKDDKTVIMKLGQAPDITGWDQLAGEEGLHINVKGAASGGKKSLLFY